MIYAPQRRSVQQQLIQRAAVHAVRVRRDRRLLAQHDLLRRRGVHGEQAPVHEAAVAQVGVVDVLGRRFEDLVHERLGGLGLRVVDEVLDDGGEEGELHLREMKVSMKWKT